MAAAAGAAPSVVVSPKVGSTTKFTKTGTAGGFGTTIGVRSICRLWQPSPLTRPDTARSSAATGTMAPGYSVRSSSTASGLSRQKRRDGRPDQDDQRLDQSRWRSIHRPRRLHGGARPSGLCPRRRCAVAFNNYNVYYYRWFRAAGSRIGPEYRLCPRRWTGMVHQQVTGLCMAISRISKFRLVSRLPSLTADGSGTATPATSSASARASTS